ncbi:MAG: hypothetical protein VX026_03580, partial [Myxococcota bacterium]|nr:hypothetical protein [Myxococcota bacterium]
MRLLQTLLIMWSTSALAHPFSKEEYSLRTALKVSEKGLVPLVALEVPIPIALKEIGADTTDPTEVKKRKIRAYNERQWDTLAENLSFTVDGSPLKGQWLAIDHPANGKAAEGFFVYMVSFQFTETPNLKDGSTIVIHNAAYPDSPMVYTASATANTPWTVASSTSKDILGEGEQAELTDPSR